MNQQLIAIISTLSSLSVLIPLVFALFHFKKAGYLFKPIIFLLLISLIIEVINIVMVYNNINNMLVFNIYGLLEALLITEFYKRFFNQFHQSIIHLILMSLFTVLFIYNTFLSHKLKNIDNISTSFESITFILYPLISFYLILKNLIFENLFKTPFFWFNTAILFYFSGNLFLFTFSSYLEQHESTYIKLYLIHSFLNVLNYLLFTIGFWKIRKHYI